jgi:hypothetical protein
MPSAVRSEALASDFDGGAEDDDNDDDNDDVCGSRCDGLGTVIAPKCNRLHS